MTSGFVRRLAGLGLPALTAVALSGCATISQRADLPGLRERLSADCAAGRFSGVMAVQRDDRLLFLHSCGWRDAEQRTPIVHDDRYKIFSISKALTGVAILRLVERDRIDLDGPLLRYLPEVPAPWAAVTVRHLLQHQSGIPDHTEKLLAAYQVGERSHVGAMARAMASLNPAEVAPLGSPGQEWRYSNFNYELLAYVAARMEQRPFHQILQEEVFNPGRMSTASVQLAAPDRSELHGVPSPGLVGGFIGSADEPEPVTVNYSFIQQGAGAVVAGYRDLLAFGRALQQGRILSAPMRARNVSESVVANPPVRYGYGWLIRPVGRCNYWQHSGGTQGYAADLAVAPQLGITVAILSNYGFAGHSNTAYRREIMELLMTHKDCEASPGLQPDTVPQQR